MQGSPLVTLWKLPSQVQRTVSPTAMFSELGENIRTPPGATVTSKVVLTADGAPETSGWPF